MHCKLCGHHSVETALIMVIHDVFLPISNAHFSPRVSWPSYFFMLKNLSSFSFQPLLIFFLPQLVWPFFVPSQGLFPLFLKCWWQMPMWYPWTSFLSLFTVDSHYWSPPFPWLHQWPRWRCSPTSISSSASFPEIQIYMSLCLPAISTPMHHRHLKFNISKIKHTLSPLNLWHHFPRNWSTHWTRSHL